MRRCGTDADRFNGQRRGTSGQERLASISTFIPCALAVLVCVLPESAAAHGAAGWDADAVADTAAPLVVSIDFDPPNAVRRADPAVYTSFDAYVVLNRANPGNLPGGLRAITLRFDVTQATSSAPQFESLLPSKLVMGGWREGITLASAPCSAEDHTVIGVLHLFYLGKPGAVRVLDHPDFPRWAVDCEDERHTFQIGSHGGIHSDPPPVE